MLVHASLTTSLVVFARLPRKRPHLATALVLVLAGHAKLELDLAFSAKLPVLVEQVGRQNAGEDPNVDDCGASLRQVVESILACLLDKWLDISWMHSSQSAFPPHACRCSALRVVHITLPGWHCSWFASCIRCIK